MSVLSTQTDVHVGITSPGDITIHITTIHYYSLLFILLQ